MNVSGGCRGRSEQAVPACHAARLVILAVLVAVMMTVSCDSTPAENGREDLRATLPLEVAGWRAVDGGEVYDTETIFQYIDGHAEVYLAYGMSRCLARRYSGPEGAPDIVLDLFELASAEDAYGVFTHDRDGEEVDVGQGALLRTGWLSFWKGRWFGSVYAEGESVPAYDAVIAIARGAADAIAEEGEVPALVSELPVDGLEVRSVRFFHTQEILNGVVYLGFENVLRFGPEIDAVLGRYEREDGNAWLLLINYPDVEAASWAESAAAEAGLAARRDRARLAVALAPEPASAADSLLADAMGEGS
jgi:hypothetical protein